MVSLTKRVLFEVIPNPPDETTLTLSSTTNKGHYISVRPFVNAEGKEFPFEWAFGGTSDHIELKKINERANSLNFNFKFDTNVKLNVPETHRGVIKTVFKTWDSGLVEETGSVFPWGTEGTEVKFRELWQPVDPTRLEFVELNNEKDVDQAANSIALSVDNEEYEGLVIVVGRWIQGILFKKGVNTLDGINLFRSQIDEKNSIVSLVKFGADADKFPQEVLLNEGSITTSKGLEWSVIESNL
ncbi:Hri1p [Kluyveromyces lactis]|uniref:Protein HRI1 n=1 Tax=Kluyveromyces lactis (strain ATCC 8585 / CBS 2359 / DSM 70799 / NBRC 1267 / NRRL Y-1140 / WM37) TaxID=284590 RepID=HRI1_KLULA|nr:uncharacterized protein KLLA0_C05390g [Kluyveromyces lactis]Q6CUE9.1 RecName: Full=Protein HRI1 [Kluyveromyces lactis NRRL Y-1140]CAH01291.1 KLLA0C05390p [Kluyveromyces lactis]|eukprot:XP_452440.1 uncharacterized protein KLLA0_C05390g [Kluyveromyces lactis]